MFVRAQRGDDDGAQRAARGAQQDGHAAEPAARPRDPRALRHRQALPRGRHRARRDVRGRRDARVHRGRRQVPAYRAPTEALGRRGCHRDFQSAEPKRGVRRSRDGGVFPRAALDGVVQDVPGLAVDAQHAADRAHRR